MILGGYYLDLVLSQDGPLKAMLGKSICRKCHPRCELCSGYGFHVHVCEKCAGYLRGEQCEDECPVDYYADEEKRECIQCDSECRGCYGGESTQCLSCRNFKIFYDGEMSENSTMFNCTKTCPPDYPNAIYSQNNIGPYCSTYAESVAQLASNQLGIAIILGVILSILCCSAIAYYLCHRRFKDREKEAVVKMALSLARTDDCEPLRPSNIGPNMSKLSFVKETQLRRGELLGRGAFGCVYKGMLFTEDKKERIPVALKVIMDASEKSSNFLDEAYIMASVDHPNILKLQAICMTNEITLITQLMPLGCLLNYVREKKSSIGSQALLNWSTQIARGMAYLEERQIVHRDLAARNVLLFRPTVVKITDFGLAKLLDCESNEYKAAGGKMPIKWLALECIQHRVFTSKSDVWAFGVTIWELLTFGERPYENIPARDVPAQIEVGVKLPQPEICSADLYCTLALCWHLDADSRPTFKQLVKQFSEYCRDPGRYISIKGDTLMRLPAYSSQDQKNLIRSLGPQNPQDMSAYDMFYMQKQNMESMPNHWQASSDTSREARLRPYCLHDPHMGEDNECYPNGCEVTVDNMRLNLPLDEDDYLMPTIGNSASQAGYMDLIGAPPSVDNPEYLMGNGTNNGNVFILNQTPKNQMSNINCSTLNGNISNSSSSSNSCNLPAPTQTIGIPLINGPPSAGEQSSSDHEYYNEIQRELQPLHRNRNETTV